MPNIVWFRRDFRLHDNTALWNAVRDSQDGTIAPVFVFDDANIRHPDTGGAIVEFMLGCLAHLQASLRELGVKMTFLHGDPAEQLVAFATAIGASGVYFNRDYHPQAIARDDEVQLRLSSVGIASKAFKDQVIYEERELLAASTGEPFTVYTPYAKAWRAKLAIDFDPKSGPAIRERPKLTPFAPKPSAAKRLNIVELYSSAELGFTDIPQIDVPTGEAAGRDMLRRWCASPIKQYKQRRNIAADEGGSSKLSAHLRHGTISPRQCVRAATFVKHKSTSFTEGADQWIGELIWREFYQQILFNFPRVVDQPFKSKLAGIRWRTDSDRFQRWCDGRTGFPIVDAGMRQLNLTGWMHNRLRMIVAMFLTKDLQIDYRWGERYFMQRLIDGETAQNNGGWQWSSSTGTDAQPYFRIFNPTSQSETCDPQGEFIRRMLPVLRAVPEGLVHQPWLMSAEEQGRCKCIIGVDYPSPMIDHATARQETLAMFKGGK